MNSHTARSTPLRRLLAVAALTLLMVPATAAAQTPSEDGYDTDGPTVLNQIDEGGQGDSGPDPTATSADRDQSASLPFTGVDLGLVAGAGVLLVGLGAGMRVALRLPPPPVR